MALLNHSKGILVGKGEIVKSFPRLSCAPAQK